MTVIKERIEAPNGSFGERLRFAREQRGLASRDVSKLLGVSDRTYKRWEADTSAPRANRMPIIAGTLNVHMRWLMSGEGDVGEPNENSASPDDRNRELLEEVRSIKEFTMGAADRLAELEGRLRKLESKTGHDEFDPEF